MRRAAIILTFLIVGLWCGLASAQEVPVAEPAAAVVTCPVGGEIQVLWNGTWYPAAIKE